MTGNRGAFEARALAPGDYELWGVVPGIGRIALGRRRIVAGRSVDIGEQRAPAGCRVAIRWGSSRPSADSSWLIEAAGRGVARPKLVLHLRTPLASTILLPGRYRLRAEGESAAGVEFLVAAGVSNRVVVP